MDSTGPLKVGWGFCSSGGGASLDHVHRCSTSFRSWNPGDQDSPQTGCCALRMFPNHFRGGIGPHTAPFCWFLCHLSRPEPSPPPQHPSPRVFQLRESSYSHNLDAVSALRGSRGDERVPGTHFWTSDRGSGGGRGSGGSAGHKGESLKAPVITWRQSWRRRALHIMDTSAPVIRNAFDT